MPVLFSPTDGRALPQTVKRISIVKPEKARKIEDGLVQMARQGALQSQVGEDRLIQMLEGISSNQPTTGKITFSRKNVDDDW